MRTFALAALAAFTSAQSLDDLPFDPTDEELLKELGVTVDTSKCDIEVDANFDVSAVRPCMDEIERVIKSVDVDGLLLEQWEDLKDSPDYDGVKEVLDSLPFYSETQADADVKELAGILDAQLKGSKLIDAGLWQSIAEDAIAIQSDPTQLEAINTDEIVKKAEAVAKVPEGLAEDLEDNKKIEAAIEELEKMVDDDGALAQAYENDSAIKAAIDAIIEEEGLTDALLDDLKTALEGSEDMTAAIDAAAVQLNIIADEAYGEITSAVDDMMGTKIPALNDEIKKQMPSSVDQFVDAAWSETNSLVQKINDSAAVSNQRSALQDQLQQIADATGSDGLDTFLTKTEKLNDDVNSATTELLESESGFSLTASVAAVLAVTTLAF